MHAPVPSVDKKDFCITVNPSYEDTREMAPKVLSRWFEGKSVNSIRVIGEFSLKNEGRNEREKKKDKNIVIKNFLRAMLRYIDTLECKERVWKLVSRFFIFFLLPPSPLIRTY